MKAYYETHEPPHCPTCGCGERPSAVQPAPIDEAAEREAFERWISAPPFDHMCDRHPAGSGWPGSYKRYETAIAWEAWKERAEK